MVELSLVQFKRSWLHDTRSIAVAFSPPWGNAWKFPAGSLDDDDVKDLVEWELQQRLHLPLEQHIFAWSRVNGDAYAVVIRPELLTFWEDMIESHGLKLKSMTMKSGLVDHQVETEADLLLLLHMWQEKGVGVVASSSRYVDDIGKAIQDADFEQTGDLPKLEVRPEEKSHDDLFTALHDKKQFSFPSIAIPYKLIFPALVAIVLLTAGWMFRDSLLGLFSRPAAVEDVVADDSAEEPAIGQEPEAPVRQNAAAAARNQSGEVLNLVYSSAVEQGVQLESLLLQGGEILIESAGSATALAGWRNAIDESLENPSFVLQARDSDHALSQLSVFSGSESQLTVTQFDLWAAELGMSAAGKQLYSADMLSLAALFTRMQDTGERPWRLSIHKSGTDSYRVMMFP